MDSTAILFFSVLTTTMISPTPKSQKALVVAYYKQSGIEKNVDKAQKRIEREVPKDAEVVMGYAAYVYKVMTEKKIAFTWRFK